MRRAHSGPPSEDQQRELQEKRIQELFAKAARQGITRKQLVHLLDASLAAGGDDAMLRGIRKRTWERSRETETLLQKQWLFHEELHAFIRGREERCHPDLRSECASKKAVLRQHFLFCKHLDLHLTKVLGRAVDARVRRRYFRDLPPGTNTRGGAIAFMFGKLKFAHNDTALLQLWHESKTLPVSDGDLNLAHGRVRTAYYEHKRLARGERETKPAGVRSASRSRKRS
jgi:hypothetical protein